MNGMLLIDKPSGMTSFDVIAILRKKLRIRKIGHTGTLDPEATGLLLVLAGNATKLVPFMDYAEKEYEAEYVLGYTSDTYDTSGKLTEVPFDKMPEENTILAALQKLTGTLTQIPPKYAAIRVQGKHLYEYAREGKEIEVPSREITVFSHEYLSSEGRIVRVRVRCSSGTYVRSLAHDFGEILGVPAVIGNLRRTSIGRFSIKDALKLEEIPADVRDIRFLTP
ncbi:MAG: tRNA pseudouridine(55) synthase TruB, partial [Erysipelotrichales bacterium]|nr:tRNA pseudouridine(55) synthase TruB [Erysipelotrichales bacterium]